MFDFLKYILPINYYRLVHRMPQGVLNFPVEVEPKVGYDSLFSEQMDAAYQNLQSGWIPNKNYLADNSQLHVVSSVKDNYIFINRYFSKAQVFYVLIVRLVSFKNPLIEFSAFFRAFKHKRIRLNKEYHLDFLNFESPLVHSNPLVSVIIPTLNRYEYLFDVLSDLVKQDYTHFEVIICDQSEPVNEVFYQGWNLKLHVVKQEEKALWMARNRCIRQSKGDFILLFDDDSRVEKNWISNHLKCLDFFDVAISAGVTNTTIGGGVGKKDAYFHLSDVFDTGNAMVKSEVFKKVGLFDRQFEKQRMGDSEFGIRSLLGGYLIISNPFAKRTHLKVETGGLRQMGSWDAVRPKKLFAPRPIPSVLYLIRKYYNNHVAVLYLLKNIPQSFIPYKLKGNKCAKVAVYLAIPIWFPLAIYSICLSWTLSSRKIVIGAKIDSL